MAMRKWLGFFAGLLLAVTTAQAFAAQPSEQQVRKLMDVIGLGKSLSQMNTQVATNMKQALPCVSSTYWQGYLDEDSTRDFIGRLIPIYQKHFTADEVDGMVKFYSSALGQKVLTEMPLALAEANQVGEQWGQQHTQQMIGKLEQAGTLGANGRCPATAFAEEPASSSSAQSPESTDAGDDTETTAAAVPAHAASISRRHGHVPVKKHSTTKKKAASAKKAVPVRKSAPAKASTEAKTTQKHHSTTKKPASGSQKKPATSSGT
jgi:hypothetical protein